MAKATHEPVVGNKYLIKVARMNPSSRNPYRLAWDTEIQTLIEIRRSTDAKKFGTHTRFVMLRPNGQNTVHQSKLALQKLAP
jgi:hypothetical protein